MIYFFKKLKTSICFAILVSPYSMIRFLFLSEEQESHENQDFSVEIFLWFIASSIAYSAFYAWFKFGGNSR